MILFMEVLRLYNEVFFPSLSKNYRWKILYDFSPIIALPKDRKIRIGQGRLLRGDKELSKVTD